MLVAYLRFIGKHDNAAVLAWNLVARRQGFSRPAQIRVPDLPALGFKAEVERQCVAINAADRTERLIGWVEHVSSSDDEAR
jgi:hypothetical protein